MSKQLPTKSEVLKEVAPFEPKTDSFKAKAKARFYRRLKERADTIDKDVVFEDRELLEELAGDKRIHGWLKEPAFAHWWWDEYAIIDQLMGLRYVATEKLQEIIKGRYTEDGDALKAIRLLFEVTDQFPSKKKEVVFLDKELENMDDREVERETIRLQDKLNTIEIEGESIEEDITEDDGDIS